MIKYLRIKNDPAGENFTYDKEDNAKILRYVGPGWFKCHLPYEGGCLSIEPIKGKEGWQDWFYIYASELDCFEVSDTNPDVAVVGYEVVTTKKIVFKDFDVTEHNYKEIIDILNKTFGAK